MTTELHGKKTEAVGPLHDIKIIDLSTATLGPVATQICGDLGANVIKIETPLGDYARHVGPRRNPGMSVNFLNMNRNKRGIVLNLKDAESHEALMRLVGGADVFVHNMRPDAAKRLGIGYEAVRARNSRIIYASAGGFHKGGSRRNRPAYDDVIQGMSGVADMFLRRDGKPAYMPMMMADKFCGYNLAMAIVTALFHRQRTGEGQEVHVPMFETMLHFNMIDQLWNGVLAEPERGLGYWRALSPLRRPFATRDGYIALMPSSEKHWQKMFILMGRPELAQDPRFDKEEVRFDNLAALYEIMAQVVTTKRTEEWLRIFDEEDIPNGPIYTLEELYNDAYLKEVGFFVRQQHPSEGAMTATNLPLDFEKTPVSLRIGPPRLGEHTREVLKGVGYGEDQISQIISRGEALSGQSSP
jgi:crotonobetainyl-CoA:carnitine CoA-transferase CaiB-like acyl-CoA transferase